MKVTSVKKFGKYEPGQVFDFPDRAAKIFIKLGKFESAEEPVIETRDLKPRRGRPPSKPAAPAEEQSYTTRDLQAE